MRCLGRPGEDEDSSSLLGISIMAVAEIAGSILVLYRWRNGITPSAEGAMGRQSEQLQEVRACLNPIRPCGTGGNGARLFMAVRSVPG